MFRLALCSRLPTLDFFVFKDAVKMSAEWSTGMQGRVSVLALSTTTESALRRCQFRPSRASPDLLDDTCHDYGHPLSGFFILRFASLDARSSLELTQGNWIAPRLRPLPVRSFRSPNFEVSDFPPEGW